MAKDFKDCYSEMDSIKIGEKTYVTGKITIGDIISFQNYCDREAKKDLIELYEMTGKEIDMKELRSLSADTEFYDQKSGSLDGVIFLFLSILKRLNKDVDMEEIKAKISVDDIERISNLISEEVDEKDEDKKDSENFPKKKVKKAEKK